MDRIGGAEAGWGLAMADDVIGAGREFNRTGAALAHPVDAAPLSALFDEMSFGLAIVEGCGKLVHASRTARLQLRSGTGLRIQGGKVEAALSAEAPALHQALQGATAGRRSYTAFGPRDSKLEVAFLPLPERAEEHAPRAALVFEKSADSGRLGLYFFAQAHRLTHTEQAVLNELCSGGSVGEAARVLGSSVHTVRTHVRNILRKTEQRSLREMIRRIGMLPPVGACFASAHARDGRC